ncbi:hypothetical protein EHS25_007859 [Saitozyma podzolica]|uniref:Uncharacterized protein n=1 Tax=Saitozyma podzolica TaxID=1890683 RepID=A0A427YQX2_9TREE|nr:hypothetical protein EHS25_007859 [Saitozyma podzolica]
MNLYPAHRIGLFVSSNWPPDATRVPYVPEVRPWWVIPSVESQLAPVMVPVADDVWMQFPGDPPARIHAAILRDPADARFPYNVHIRMIVEGMLIGLVVLLLILVAAVIGACTWYLAFTCGKWLLIRGIRGLLCLPVVARQLELDPAYMCSAMSTSGT